MSNSRNFVAFLKIYIKWTFRNIFCLYFCAHGTVKHSFWHLKTLKIWLPYKGGSLFKSYIKLDANWIALNPENVISSWNFLGQWKLYLKCSIKYYRIFEVTGLWAFTVTKVPRDCIFATLLTASRLLLLLLWIPI